MKYMFNHASSFNADLSKWDVSSVTDMPYMFSATCFNGDLSKWGVSSVTSMDFMFLNAASFNQKLCGIAWVNSKASKSSMFAGSSGSIARAVCTSDPTPETLQQHVSRRPIPERELIVRKSISTPSVTSMIVRNRRCPRCGTFRKSGRISCCAPGGAWFMNCGGLGSNNVDHRWSDGVAACKRKFKADDIVLHD